MKSILLALILAPSLILTSCFLMASCEHKCQPVPVVQVEQPFQMSVKGHRYNAFAAADAPFLLEYDGHLWVAVMLQHSDLCGCKEYPEDVWHEPTNNDYELGN